MWWLAKVSVSRWGRKQGSDPVLAKSMPCGGRGSGGACQIYIPQYPAGDGWDSGEGRAYTRREYPVNYFCLYNKWLLGEHPSFCSRFLAFLALRLGGIMLKCHKMYKSFI